MHGRLVVLRAECVVAAVACVACGDDGRRAPTVTPTFRESTEASELASLTGALESLELGDAFAPWALDFHVRGGAFGEVHRLEASEARLESQVVHSGKTGVVATTYYQALLPEPLPPIVLDVITKWRTNPRGDGLLGTIEVQLDERQPPDIYLAAVEFPRLALPSYGADDRLVLPWGGGYVVEDPISQPFAIDPSEPGILSFPALALIDGASGAHIYLSNTDREATWKRLRLRSDPVRRELRFSVVQYPAEPWVQSDYTSPYAVEIALGHGDWFDVGKRYNAFLAEESAPRSEPRGLDAEPVWFGDFRAAPGALMASARHTDALARELGPGLVAWHDIATPGGLGRCAPGRPHGTSEYATARQRAMVSGAVRLAPWMESALGRNPESFSNARERETQESAVIRLEHGNRSMGQRGDDASVYFCPGSEWWASKLPETVAAFDQKFGLDAVFLRNFGMLGSCFDPTHAHPTGHGSWFASAKLAQLERIAAELKREAQPERVVPIAIEGLIGRFAEHADLMFLDPFVNTTPLAPTRLHSVPLFRVAWDGVRLATLGVRDDVAASRTGELAYQQAFRCLQAGLVLSTGRSLGSASEPIAGEDAAYRRYLRSLATLIGEHGFARFHRGQLGRTPRLEIDGLFSARSDFGPLSVHTPSQMQLLPLGFYADRDSDECAFVITNPWIGPCPLRDGDVTVDYVATVELSEHHPELAGRFLVRELTALGGSSPAHIATYGDELRFVGRLQPGETHFWTLTPTRERR
ncbi:MAG: DUF6259 domain-containing protein [Planctomycetota bacterium]